MALSGADRRPSRGLSAGRNASAGTRRDMTLSPRFAQREGGKHSNDCKQHIQSIAALLEERAAEATGIDRSLTLMSSRRGCTQHNTHMGEYASLQEQTRFKLQANWAGTHHTGPSRSHGQPRQSPSGGHCSHRRFDRCSPPETQQTRRERGTPIGFKAIHVTSFAHFAHCSLVC